MHTSAMRGLSSVAIMAVACTFGACNGARSRTPRPTHCASRARVSVVKHRHDLLDHVAAFQKKENRHTQGPLLSTLVFPLDPPPVLNCLLVIVGVLIVTRRQLDLVALRRLVRDQAEKMR